ncbi:MAG: hypothetical protein B6244_07370 [Candidatus Cloacimonetes bacterium 4572_55]|nr:MAG: hypothetical protein B6244_07370 [Candidatus Cloacimonetes bacterium 4572_55]
MRNKHLTPKQLLIKTLFWGLIIWICGTILLPIFAVTMYSLADETTYPRSGGDMVIPPHWGQEGNLLHHFKMVWILEDLPVYLARSLVLALGTVILSITLSAPAAYAFVRFRFPFRKILLLSFFVFMMMPDIVFGVSLFSMFYKWGLINTIIGVIMVHTLRAIPLTLLILNGVFESIPPTLEEAAFTMGTSRLRTLRKVILPLSAPGVAAASIYAFLLSWDDFVLTVLVGGPESYNLAVLASRFMIGTDVQHYRASATAVIMLVPVLFVNFFVQRYMKSDYLTGGMARDF